MNEAARASKQQQSVLEEYKSSVFQPHQPPTFSKILKTSGTLSGTLNLVAGTGLLTVSGGAALPAFVVAATSFIVAREVDKEHAQNPDRNMAGQEFKGPKKIVSCLQAIDLEMTATAYRLLKSDALSKAGEEGLSKAEIAQCVRKMQKLERDAKKLTPYVKIKDTEGDGNLRFVVNIEPVKEDKGIYTETRMKYTLHSEVIQQFSEKVSQQPKAAAPKQNKISLPLKQNNR